MKTSIYKKKHKHILWKLGKVNLGLNCYLLCLSKCTRHNSEQIQYEFWKMWGMQWLFFFSCQPLFPFRYQENYLFLLHCLLGLKRKQMGRERAQRGIGCRACGRPRVRAPVHPKEAVREREIGDRWRCRKRGQREKGEIRKGGRATAILSSVPSPV